MPIDPIDRRILDQLQRDANQTNQMLADRVGLSPSACLLRVRRLRENGIIRQTVALLDPEALGTCLHLIVEVTMSRDELAMYERFERRMHDFSEVGQCYRVTGDSDLILILTVGSMEEFDRFCTKALYAEADVHKFRTLVARKRSKFDTAIVLP